jgi:hypothetical protein
LGNPMFDSPAASELTGCSLDLNASEWGEKSPRAPNRRAKSVSKDTE